MTETGTRPAAAAFTTPTLQPKAGLRSIHVESDNNNNNRLHFIQVEQPNKTRGCDAGIKISSHSSAAAGCFKAGRSSVVKN